MASRFASRPRRVHHRSGGERSARRRASQEINDAYRTAARPGRLARVLEYSEEPLVSSDIINSTASCVFDSALTMAQGHLVKVLGWYDNESGYSSRLADLAAMVGAAS